MGLAILMNDRLATPPYRYLLIIRAVNTPNQYLGPESVFQCLYFHALRFNNIEAAPNPIAPTAPETPGAIR
jgi:hypothetical protein